MGRSCPPPLSSATSFVACSISARLAWRVVLTAVCTNHWCPRSLRWGVLKAFWRISELHPPKSNALPGLRRVSAFLNSPRVGCQSPGVANRGRSGLSSPRGQSLWRACIQTSEVMPSGGGGGAQLSPSLPHLSSLSGSVEASGRVSAEAPIPNNAVVVA